MVKKNPAAKSPAVSPTDRNAAATKSASDQVSDLRKQEFKDQITAAAQAETSIFTKPRWQKPAAFLDSLTPAVDIKIRFPRNDFDSMQDDVFSLFDEPGNFLKSMEYKVAGSDKETQKITINYIDVGNVVTEIFLLKLKTLDNIQNIAYAEIDFGWHAPEFLKDLKNDVSFTNNILCVVNDVKITIQENGSYDVKLELLYENSLPGKLRYLRPASVVSWKPLVRIAQFDFFGLGVFNSQSSVPFKSMTNDDFKQVAIWFNDFAKMHKLKWKDPDDMECTTEGVAKLLFHTWYFLQEQFQDSLNYISNAGQRSFKTKSTKVDKKKAPAETVTDIAKTDGELLDIFDKETQNLQKFSNIVSNQVTRLGEFALPKGIEWEKLIGPEGKKSAQPSRTEAVAPNLYLAQILANLVSILETHLIHPFRAFAMNRYFLEKELQTQKYSSLVDVNNYCMAPFFFFSALKDFPPSFEIDVAGLAKQATKKSKTKSNPTTNNNQNAAVIDFYYPFINRENFPVPAQVLSMFMKAGSVQLLKGTTWGNFFEMMCSRISLKNDIPVKDAKQKSSTNYSTATVTMYTAKGKSIKKTIEILYKLHTKNTGFKSFSDIITEFTADLTKPDKEGNSDKISSLNKELFEQIANVLANDGYVTFVMAARSSVSSIFSENLGRNNVLQGYSYRMLEPQDAANGNPGFPTYGQFDPAINRAADINFPDVLKMSVNLELKNAMTTMQMQAGISTSIKTGEKNINSSNSAIKQYEDNIADLSSKIETKQKEVNDKKNTKKRKANEDELESLKKQKTEAETRLSDFKSEQIKKDRMVIGKYPIKLNFNDSLAKSVESEVGFHRDTGALLTNINNFRKRLAIEAHNAKIDLEILGDPNYDINSTGSKYIYIKVTNNDGSPSLFTGFYSVHGVTHTIFAGKFITKLSVMQETSKPDFRNQMLASFAGRDSYELICTKKQSAIKKEKEARAALEVSAKAEEDKNKAANDAKVDNAKKNKNK